MVHSEHAQHQQRYVPLPGFVFSGNKDSSRQSLVDKTNSQHGSSALLVGLRTCVQQLEVTDVMLIRFLWIELKTIELNLPCRSGLQQRFYFF